MKTYRFIMIERRNFVWVQFISVTKLVNENRKDDIRHIWKQYLFCKKDSEPSSNFDSYYHHNCCDCDCSILWKNMLIQVRYIWEIDFLPKNINRCYSLGENILIPIFCHFHISFHALFHSILGLIRKKPLSGNHLNQRLKMYRTFTKHFWIW